MIIETDVAIIGAGFYGCNIALALKDLGFGRVDLVDAAEGVMTRASYVNQARVHNGYHYPRSLQTAESSRQNYQRFLGDYAYGIEASAPMVYAVAHGSKVSAQQFSRFCSEIGAPCHEDSRARALFDPNLIEACFSVDELAFDSRKIASELSSKLRQAGIRCHFGSEVAIRSFTDTHVNLCGAAASFKSRYVLNCTYANLDRIGITPKRRLKKELAEIALIRPPFEISDRAVTIIDGPFFSTMPFPANNCFSLTHVRYTPHGAPDCYDSIRIAPNVSRFDAMLRDSARYMPVLAKASYLGSLFEIKAILEASEEDDSRPIVVEEAAESERILSILGSKIDNIYDIIEYLKNRPWQLL